MDFRSSQLSNPKYGIDCVIATTQASIDSNLKHYLSEGGFRPKGFACIGGDSTYSLGGKWITLDELAERTDVDPTQIVDGTPWDDSKVRQLTAIDFRGCFLLQPGLPEDVMPKDLPSALVLGVSGNASLLNMFCGQFRIFQVARESRSWQVWEQTADNYCYPRTVVWPVKTLLPNDLDTAYFNKRPEAKTPLKDKLNSLEHEFSVQQVLFDLERATKGKMMGRIPNHIIGGIKVMVSRCALDAYKASVKEAGELPLAVTVTPYASNLSHLQITGMEHQVSRYKDSTGSVVEKPTPQQQDISTLDHLCALNHRPLPSRRQFDWNWVLPEDRDQFSGVIAINRETIGKFLLDQLLPVATRCCVKPLVTSMDIMGVPYFSTKFSPASPDDLLVAPFGGQKLIEIKSTQGSSETAVNSRLGIWETCSVTCQYVCSVRVEGDVIKVQQTQNMEMSLLNKTVTPVRKTIIDEYRVLVNSEGSLDFSKLDTHEENHPDPSHPSPDGGVFERLLDIFVPISRTFEEFEKDAKAWGSTNLKSDTLKGLQNFVFPGSRIFAYKSAAFSHWNDLVCAITYVEPNYAEPSALQTFTKRTLLNTPDDKPMGTDSKLLKVSSKLMQNYICGSIVSLNSKFEALQTVDGRALLLGIRDDGRLWVIEEQSGKTTTGWEQFDISSKVITEHLGEKVARQAQVGTFDAAQSALNGTIGLAMAVSAGNGDHLLVSMNNSSFLRAWVHEPGWKEVPFSAKQDIKIAGIFFTETSTGAEYLLVDLIEEDKIKRYYVDPSKESGEAWARHELPFDIKPGGYQSCVGRVSGERIDGIYTRGEIGKTPQLGYVPTINAWGKGPPTPRLLHLPNDAKPEAIATARNNDGSQRSGTTDLFATSGTTLYRWASTGQKNRAIAMPVLKSDILNNTSTLHAMTHNGVTTVWGLNGAGQVYYVSCSTSNLATGGSWSAPMPILSDVSRLSPYVNRTDGGNTIFATRGTELFRILQATDTTSKLWRPQYIRLKPDTLQEALPFTSYTTAVSVSNVSDKLPAGETRIAITASSRTPAYVNGIYYILGHTPVNVLTDLTGKITVVEATDDLNAAVLTFSVDGGHTTETINPMEEPFKKVTALNTADKLRGAQVADNPQEGGVMDDHAYKPLVRNDVAEDDIRAAAEGLQSLNSLYSNLDRDNRTTTLLQDLDQRVIPATLLPRSVQTAAAGFLDELWAAPGDLYRLLKVGADAVVKVVWDAATDAWHFVVEIGKIVYRAILDTVHAIMGAVEWVFSKIKATAKDLIHFLQHLFHWDDIRRTKEVLHNILHQFIQHQVEEIGTFKGFLNENIDKVRDSLEMLLGEKDWSGLENHDAFKHPLTNSAKSFNDNMDPASQLLLDHFRHNVSQITEKSSKPVEFSSEEECVLQGLEDKLLHTVQENEDALFGFYEKVVGLVHNFHDLSVMDILKRLFTILSDAALLSTRLLLDIVLDILAIIIKQLVGVLEIKIHVPVVSYILNNLGVPDTTLLDLFCWIAAVDVTSIYMVINNKAPFPQNDAEGKALIEADSWKRMTGLFQQQKVPKSSPRTISSAGIVEDILPLSDETKATVFMICNFGVGGLTAASLLVNIPEANSPVVPFMLGLATGTAGFITALLGVAGNILTPRYPIENTIISRYSTMVGIGAGMFKLALSGILQNKFAGKLGFGKIQATGSRQIGAIVNAVFIVPQMMCTGWHFFELAGKSPSYDQTAGIFGEMASLASYGTRLMYTAAVNDPEPETREMCILVYILGHLSQTCWYMGRAAVPYD